jgi:hypothetical protein
MCPRTSDSWFGQEDVKKRRIMMWKNFINDETS